jgi:hypothetical protein
MPNMQLYPKSRQAVLGYWDRQKQFPGDIYSKTLTILEALDFRNGGTYVRAEQVEGQQPVVTAQGRWTYNPATGAVTLTPSTGPQEVLNFPPLDANSLSAGNGLPFSRVAK